MLFLVEKFSYYKNEETIEFFKVYCFLIFYYWELMSQK